MPLFIGRTILETECRGTSIIRCLRSLRLRETAASPPCFSPL